MDNLEYEYAKGRLQGLNEAIELMYKHSDYMGLGADEVVRLANNLEIKLSGETVFDEVEVLKSENALLKRTFYELKKHTTGGNALKFCLQGCKELEDNAKDLIYLLRYNLNDDLNKTNLEWCRGLAYALDKIKQKFNLKEDGKENN